MLTFAGVFWSTVEKNMLAAFAGASLAWLIVSVAAWYARRKIRMVGRAEENGGSSVPRRPLV